MSYKNHRHSPKVRSTGKRTGGRIELQKPTRLADPFLEELHAIRSDVGRRIDPMNAARDTSIVMRAYDLPESFPKGVRAEA